MRISDWSSDVCSSDLPVTGQRWTGDPWTVRQADNRLYGRGTCDMKGFCGVALSLLPEFVAARLARPLILAFSYDEEIGCVGAPAMIAAIGASLRSEEHTSELQSLMRISYAVFCLKKKKQHKSHQQMLHR